MTDTSMKERLARRAARSAGMPEDKSWAYQTMVDDILAELAELTEGMLEAAEPEHLFPTAGARGRAIASFQGSWRWVFQHIRDGGS